MEDKQDHTAIEFHDKHFYDCFEPIFESGAKLQKVTYYANNECDFIEIIELIFTDKNIRLPIYLKVNSDFDTIEIYDHFPAVDICYRSFIPQTIWDEIIGYALVWVWKIQNHQGYVDGIQFEFQSQKIIQIMGLASQLNTLHVTKEIRIIDKFR